jgi:hypothetical protein
MQKIQNQQQASTSPSQSPDSAAHSPQLHASTITPQQLQQNMFGLSPTNALAYQMSQMTPMMQMQMQMGMGMGMGMGNTFGIPSTTQAMHQSVMRHASPGPPPVDGPGFMF